jgi:trans-aconitate 2-methyltransferase
MHKWDPAAYEKSSSAQQKWAKEVLSKIAIRGDEKVLDIGCGDGKITAEMASLVPDGSVVGIDNSREMIGFARSKFQGPSHPNLSFSYGDASDLKYQGEFDLVVSFACLHWILDHIPVLESIERSLKSGGRVFLQFGGKGNAAGIIQAASEVISCQKWSEYFKGFEFPYGFFGPDEYHTWLGQVGLKAIRVEILPKDMVQPGRDGLASWVETTWLPYLEKVPGNLRRDFVYEVTDAYISSHPPDVDGLVHVDMKRLEVEAEKI